jgi:hypothetical protein
MSDESYPVPERVQQNAESPIPNLETYREVVARALRIHAEYVRHVGVDHVAAGKRQHDLHPVADHTLCAVITVGVDVEHVV